MYDVSKVDPVYSVCISANSVLHMVLVKTLNFLINRYDIFSNSLRFLLSRRILLDTVCSIHALMFKIKKCYVCYTT